MRDRLPLALTMGEPAGIGPDITLRAWDRRREHDLAPFYVIGVGDTFGHWDALMGLGVPVVPIMHPSQAIAAFPEGLPVLTIADAPSPIVVPGKPDPATAATTIAAIDMAVAHVRAGHASAVVTNPIAKNVLYAAGFAHPGHTEYLAELAARYWGGPVPRPVMMIASDVLRVVPLTIHMPLAKVPGAITSELIEATCRITHASLINDFGIARPRIAVAGLNPHAGESGTIGREDVEIIAPAIARLQALGLSVTGPHPADTLFHPAARARYDVAIGMYHDQVLVPVKTLAFDTGVNVTMGLPFVRTSPDHGTAFDIAGTGQASAESLIAALDMAARMVRYRRQAENGVA
jgi:4-hydroxythreonine-4-phosphate dehydrogenase